MNNSGITILNVDSADAGLYVKSRILREAGYKVIEARTGAEALRLIGHASPQLVLLSVSLPDMSGLEVCRRIKIGSDGASALVLLVSASFVGCEKRARSLEDGADGYLLEPVTPEFLLANVKTLLRLRRDETDRERAAFEERRQAWALRRLAQFAFDINSAETLDEILQIVTDKARDLIGAHQAASGLTADLLAANVMAVNGDSPRHIRAVSLSERYAAWRDYELGELGARGAAWMRSLVCRMNQPMRLTQVELESQFVCCESRVGQPLESRREFLVDRIEGRASDGLILPEALEGVMTPREFAALRELAVSRELAALREVATPREVATLRELAPLRDSQMLPGLEMRGWLAAPLISRDGRNLGLIQLSDKYDGEFTEQDEAMLVQLTRMVSIAIENRQLYRWEQERRVAAENAARATNEFLAMVSHKLRTPLNAVLGWAWVLRRQACGAESVARAAEVIERNARAQAQLVEDLMEVSRRDAGRLRLDLRPLEIAPLVVAACDNLRPAAETKGLELKLVVDPRAGTIIGDHERLQQIVWNLLSNAIRATPAAGRVELRLERVGAELRLTVSDTGKGFSTEALPFVFDRFRGSSLDGAAGAPRRRGLGLGLAMVRYLVEMHGGSVSVSSPGEGRGATFAIKLPVNAVRAEQEDETLDEWRNGRAEEWENGRGGRRERNGAELSVPPPSHLPISYSPSPASRGASAGGGR